MAEIKQVMVPDIGGYKDVSIIEVMVKVGDTVKAEDNLVTLETDKAAMEVPSPYAGVIKEMKVKVGDKVSQGSLILLLESSDAAGVPQNSQPAVQPAPAPATAPVAAPVAVAPAVVQTSQPAAAGAPVKDTPPAPRPSGGLGAAK